MVMLRVDEGGFGPRDHGSEADFVAAMWRRVEGGVAPSLAEARELLFVVGEQCAEISVLKARLCWLHDEVLGVGV